MQQPTPTSSNPAAPAVDYRHRKHTLTPPRNLLHAAGRSLLNGLESAVAAVSLHGDTPVYNPETFPWVKTVESEWKLIRSELDQVMRFRDQIPSFHEILKEAGTITQDDQWKTFFLIGVGMDCAGNAQRCPQTMRLLAKIPGVKTAFFSILSPKKHIPAHRGAFNGVLRFHLGLLVPEPREKCRIRIANDFHSWSEGKALLFDDTFNHEVWNDTDGYRVVLFVDFARPLKQPFHWLNERIMSMAAIAPFLREAGAKQKTWEKKFYDQKKP